MLYLCIVIQITHILFPRDVTIAASRESKKFARIMAIKVKAIERNVSFQEGVEKFAYVLQADLYSRLSDTKVI